MLSKAVKDKCEYGEVIGSIKEKIKTVLKKDVCLSEDVIRKIPIVEAGDKEPSLPDIDNWEYQLFLASLEKVDPNVLPSLLQLRLNYEELITGGAIGGIAGIVIGGLVGGPLGSSLGYVTATAFGAAVGGATGGGTGAVAGSMLYHTLKLRCKESKITNLLSYKRPYQATEK